MSVSGRWHFILTDGFGNRVGEIINAYEREFTANLSKPATASFQIRKDNALVPYLFSETEDYFLQVWQGEVLRFWGPILTTNYVAQDGSPASIAVNAADPMWYMTKRFAWKPETNGYLLSGDKITIAEGYISYQYEREPFRVGNPGGQLSGNTGTYLAGPFKEGLAVINDLSQGFDGFDWYIEPVATPWTSTNANLPGFGTFRAAAVVGSAKPNVVFEYGTGRRNMRGMNFLQDQTTRANVAWNVSELGSEASAANPSPYLAKSDPTNYGRYGIFEEMAELSSVNNVAMREQYTQEMVNVRKNKRRVLSMTSDIDDGTGRVPRFGVDYWLGDTITAHGVDEGFTLFSGQVRVYSTQVKLNDAGTATYTPILVQESSS